MKVLKPGFKRAFLKLKATSFLQPSVVLRVFSGHMVKTNGIQDKEIISSVENRGEILQHERL